MTGYALLCAGILLASACVTWWVRRRALSRGQLDYPNARSSHAVPTPRGGGLSIVACVMAGTAVLIFVDAIAQPLATALAAGGAAIACVGYFDDRYSLPALVRLAVHVGAALLAVALLGGLPPLQWGAGVVDLGIAGDLLAVLAIVWAINLFNFMDGIDGLAASEAVFITTAGAMLALVHGGSSGLAAVALVVGCASAGFLAWNWPPARIFMGDVGSGYLGYVIVVLALAAGREDPVAPYAWLILGGVFFVDATVTLLRRAARRERVFEAHRIHGYQWLARRLNSHLRATVILMAVNLLWLLPCAGLSYRYPAAAPWIVVLALVPLAIGLLAVGAGKPESGTRDPVKCQSPDTSRRRT